MYGVAVWELNDTIARSDSFKIYIRGLSNGSYAEKTAEGKEIVRYKTLRLNFASPGDERNRGEYEIRLLDLETFAPGEVRHVGVGFDAARLDPRVAEEHEELTPPATDVENRRRVAEVLDVYALPLAHDLGRPSHAAFEAEVVG